MKTLLFKIALVLPMLNNAQGLLNGLQACYPMDCDNVLNYASTGAPLDGTPFNALCTNDHVGNPNSAYYLQGNANSYIELPDDARIRGNRVCFSGWFEIGTIPAEQYLVFTKNNCATNFEAYSLITVYSAIAGQQVFRVSKSGPNCTYQEIESTTIFPVSGNWYHIAFYIDDHKMWLYINGQHQMSVNHTIAFNYMGGKKVYLGGTNETSFNWPFNGSVDNVRFYDRELLHTEILNLYQNDPGCNIPRTVGINENSNKESQLSISPNPGTGRFQLEHLSEVELSVTDIAGRNVNYELIPIGINRTELNLSTEPGIYLVNVYTKSGEYLESKKVMVQQP